MKILIKFIFLITFYCSYFDYAFANLNFKIDDLEIPKIKILFSINQNSNQKLQSEVKSILFRIEQNLLSTNLFEIINHNSVPLSTIGNISIESVPNFNIYKNSDISMMMIVDAKYNAISELELKIRFWDILDERQLFGKYYAANEQNYKKMSNLISDEIFKASTGENYGHFDSKIFYVAESGNAKTRIKKIAAMDFDGENIRYLTNGRDLVLTPTFIKEKEELLFVRFFGEKPQIYSLDINNFLTRKIGGFKTMTFAPTVNPNNPDIIAFCVVNSDGDSNIYEMNLLTNKATKLTNSKAIDATPSYSPDGNNITFSSDRSGLEQIYIMENNGRNIKKITSDNANYSKPIWSPDGKFIAFTKMKSGQFYIGIIDPEGRNEKIISSGYLVEGAKWSPNSRYLIYSKKSGSFGRSSIPRLYIVDIITGFERELRTPEREGATDPEWVSF